MLVKLLATSSIQSPVNLGEDQIYVRANSGQDDRAGDEMYMPGADLTNYRKNPVVLADHDRTKVVGNFAPIIKGGAMEGVITFAPTGISALADELRAMYKAGVRRAFSIGFKPIKAEPKKSGGYRYLAWELLELSCVSIPCDADALVIARSLTKAGQVLSGTNAQKLQQAHDAAESCRALVADVLGGAEAGDTDEAKAKRQREIEILGLAAPSPMTRAERMAVARELDITFLRGAS